MLKLNVDAAIDSGKQMAGLGAIIRDSNGNSVAAAVKTSHFWRDVFHAEAEATDWGLQMAEQANLNSLIVQSDCQEVISDLIESKGVICVDNWRGVTEISLDFLHDRVKVRASCNGLLCCSSIPEMGVYYVCNPMTREWKLLPKSRERPVTRFYPDGEATLVGLACDLAKNKYNVVLAGYHRAFGHRPDGTFKCLVFDSESNRWRKFVSVQDYYQFSIMNRNQVVFVNGALHWLTDSCSFILALDLEGDVWRKISLPEKVGSESRSYLLECDGCLSVIEISDVWMETWVLKDYYRDEWHLVDKVSLRCIKGMVPSIFPISQTREYVFLATHKQVLVYHRNGRLWKEMYSVKYGSTLPLWFSAHAFRSTILSCN
ncbi:F-box protein [Citrus sinensis]|nr:F-box protein [Citrus sinensis]